MYDLIINDNQLLLPDNRLITLNSQQYEGIKLIRGWLNSRDKFFTLAGYAGSGKTTCLKKILDEIRMSVVISAPTHKAKKIAMKTTGQDGETLQSLLGLRPDVSLDGFNPNYPTFDIMSIPLLGNYSLVIIDEASMINSELFNLIETISRRTDSKILFIGDPAQIPPVNEAESAVFANTSIKSHWLTKIERQNESNPLCVIYDTLRNNLTKIDNIFDRKTNMNNNGEGVYFTSDKYEFRKRLLKEFSSDEYKENIDHAKLIAWQNETVQYSNKIIRDHIIGQNCDVVEIGDILMGYKSVADSKRMYNVIENSADYKIIGKSDRIKSELDLFGYKINVKENNDPTGYVTELFIVDTNDEKNMYLFGQYHDFYRDMAKKNKKLWNKYFDFRRENMILRNIDKYDNVNERVNDIITKDLDYAYAITGHKAQGSTYTHVFILEDDINTNRSIKERNQLLYTSLTRPTTSATILSSKAIA
jgi:exodeoxyribonuclease-5